MNHDAHTLLDRSRQAAPQIAEALRGRILATELRPNQVLSRAALQDEFGVSQTPIRDALMALQQEGLVDVYPQSGTIVSRIDLVAARQAQFLRLAIELEAVRRVAAAPGSEVIHQLRQSLARQDECRHPDQHERFEQEDRLFHRTFYLAAGVPHLWELVRRESGHVDRLRRLHLPLAGKLEAILHEHRALVLETERADPEAAAAVLRQHLSGTLAVVGEIRQRYPDYFSGS